MEITEVRIKLMDDPHDRLQAFCSVTFDSCFVVRDLKIIQGTKGAFVAMPSRKLSDRCARCGTKNHLRAVYCNQCGGRLDENRAVKDNDGRAKLYADVAHPINSQCRDLIQRRVLQAFEDELVRSQQPDYVCTYDDFADEGEYDSAQSEDVRQPHGGGDEGRGASRRIEPAAHQPGPPHHHTPAGQRERVSSVRQRTHSGGHDDEPFGAGLL